MYLEVFGIEKRKVKILFVTCCIKVKIKLIVEVTVSNNIDNNEIIQNNELNYLNLKSPYTIVTKPVH